MEICTRNVNTAFKEIVSGLDDQTITNRWENTRNGRVMRVNSPLLITYGRPTERVLFNAARDANPFFHLYEALWMLAGRNDLAPLAYYNPKMAEFSDDGKTLNGAYGYRWRCATEHEEFDTDRCVDQLQVIIDHLKRNPQSRRAVLAMWNVEDDLLKIDTSKDVCCNLDVIFDIRDSHPADDGTPLSGRWLDMTVINRSNDLIWGTLGANAVHFSILQEYVAACLGVEVGVYNQFSTNAHVYDWNWKPEEWLAADNEQPFGFHVSNPDDWGEQYREWKTIPLVKDPATFDKECAMFVEFNMGQDQVEEPNWEEPFLADVAQPMMEAFYHHKHKYYEFAMESCNEIKADDWRIAARNWIERRKAKWESKSAADRRGTL